MDGNRVPYVHVLLFRCKGCNRPLAVSVVTEAANLEAIDGDLFDLKCDCGWLERLCGVEACRHWAVLWEAMQGVGHLTDARKSTTGPSPEA